MKASQVLATVAVSDFATSSAWYARLFGRAPDHCSSTSCAEWQIASSAMIQLMHKDTFVEARNSSGRVSIGIVVEDLDSALSDMRKRQIDVAPPMTATHFVRFAPVIDPDGNRVTFVESAAG